MNNSLRNVKKERGGVRVSLFGILQELSSILPMLKPSGATIVKQAKTHLCVYSVPRVEVENH